jgi:hypothetical protein
MKQPNLFVKAAVITSSVLLVGGLVAYRAGAIDWLNGDKPTTMGGSKSKVLIDPASPITPGAETPTTVDPWLMSGSKSAAVFVPSPSTTPAVQPADAKAPAPTIMPGSKAFAPLISVPPVTSQPPPPSK